MKNKTRVTKTNMRISSILLMLAIFLTAGGVCTFVAMKAADLIEDRSRTAVTDALVSNQHAWVSVHVDGLRVELTGTATDEAARFRALSVVNGIVDAERVIDNMEVADAAAIKAPKFSIEILRGSTGISLIGLVPASTNRAALVSSLKALKNVGWKSSGQITDMLDTADFPVPDGWDKAVRFGINALRSLPKSKISITAEHVAITAISGSIEEKHKIEAALARQAPPNLDLIINITAPRPVITPFTLRFLINRETVRFDACSADTEKTRAVIIKAALDAGLKDAPDCTIGLGVPTPSWGQAVATGIGALKEIGGGTITYSDADVTLVAFEGTPQGLFDRVIGELEADLPDVFSLHSVLPKAAKTGASGEAVEAADFVATLSPEGQVQLRGRITDERSRAAVYSYARARFGSQVVYGAARLDDELPQGWSLRVLTGVQALAELKQGSVVVQADFINVRGLTGNPDARANIARLLSEKLGSYQDYNIDVTYQKKLDPVASLMDPKECIIAIDTAKKERKISFEPGSSDLDASGLAVIARIAEIIKTCNPLKLEIAGFTDSQGREEMNQSLSQARADAVLHGMMNQRVLTSGMVAIGHGESAPIADNDTAQGREANRRIEFKLILPKETVPELTGLEQLEAEKLKTDAAEPQAETSQPETSQPETSQPETSQPETSESTDE